MPLHGFNIETGMAATAKEFGGSGSDFKQDAYVAAWIKAGGLAADQSGGVCQGLSSMWIAARGDWSVFKNTVQSPGGVAKVREFMDMQEPVVKGGLGLRASRLGVSKLAVKQIQLFQLHHTGETLEGDKMKRVHVANFAAKAGFTYAGIYANKEGHALAMQCDDGEWKFFDPNLGVATFKTQALFTDCVQAILESAYGEYNQDFCCLRFAA